MTGLQVVILSSGVFFLGDMIIHAYDSWYVGDEVVESDIDNPADKNDYLCECLNIEMVP